VVIGLIIYEMVKNKKSKKNAEAFKKLSLFMENYYPSKNPKTLAEIIHENNL
jgi:hypothetical protein